MEQQQFDPEGDSSVYAQPPRERTETFGEWYQKQGKGKKILLAIGGVLATLMLIGTCAEPAEQTSNPTPVTQPAPAAAPEVSKPPRQQKASGMTCSMYEQRPVGGDAWMAGGYLHSLAASVNAREPAELQQAAQRFTATSPFDRIDQGKAGEVAQKQANAEFVAVLARFCG